MKYYLEFRLRSWGEPETGSICLKVYVEETDRPASVREQVFACASKEQLLAFLAKIVNAEVAQ